MFPITVYTAAPVLTAACQPLNVYLVSILSGAQCALHRAVHFRGVSPRSMSQGPCPSGPRVNRRTGPTLMAQKPVSRPSPGPLPGSGKSSGQCQAISRVVVWTEAGGLRLPLLVWGGGQVESRRGWWCSGSLAAGGQGVFLLCWAPCRLHHPASLQDL